MNKRRKQTDIQRERKVDKELRDQKIEDTSNRQTFSINRFHRKGIIESKNKS